MILKRLFPTRWARIAAWTAAALAWGTSVVTFAANAGVTAEPALPPIPDPTTTTTTSTTTTAPAPIPNQPERGLVVLRYTPVPPPPPQVIVRKVVVAGPSGGGGGGSGGGGASTGTTKAAPPAKTVKSSGS